MFTAVFKFRLPKSSNQISIWMCKAHTKKGDTKTSRRRVNIAVLLRLDDIKSTAHLTKKPLIKI